MFEAYQRECKLEKIKIGLSHVWTDKEANHHSATIINFLTKVHWRIASGFAYSYSHYTNV